MTEEEWATLKQVFAFTDSKDEVSPRPHLVVIQGGKHED